MKHRMPKNKRMRFGTHTAPATSATFELTLIYGTRWQRIKRRLRQWFYSHRTFEPVAVRRVETKLGTVASYTMRPKWSFGFGTLYSLLRSLNVITDDNGMNSIAVASSVAQEMGRAERSK